MSNRKIIIRRAARNKNFSSGELGAQTGTRRITISGTGQLNAPLLTVEGAEQFLQNAIRQQDGWNFVNFDFAQVGNISITGKRQFSVNVVADVPAAYTNQQHLDEFVSILNTYALDYLIGSTKGISDLKLKISGVDADGTQKTLSAGNPDLDEIKKKASEGDFFATLATTLGISIPIATGLTAIALILILKR